MGAQRLRSFFDDPPPGPVSHEEMLHSCFVYFLVKRGMAVPVNTIDVSSSDPLFEREEEMYFFIPENK